MKKLHKKIIAGALIGAISIGGFLSQGSQAFANLFDDEIDGPVDVPKDEEPWYYLYMKMVGEHFGFRISSHSKNNNNLFAEKFFKNPGDFAQYLYNNGMKKGSVFYWIGGEYYKLEFPKRVGPVDPWNQWEDGDGLPRFYNYFYEHIK